jgi:hypothetical protein
MTQTTPDAVPDTADGARRTVRVTLGRYPGAETTWKENR